MASVTSVLHLLPEIPLDYRRQDNDFDGSDLHKEHGRAHVRISVSGLGDKDDAIGSCVFTITINKVLSFILDHIAHLCFKTTAAIRYYIAPCAILQAVWSYRTPRLSRPRSMSSINRAVPGADQYYPLNEPAIGSAFSDTNLYPQNKEIPKLFQPITIRNVEFKNRIFVAPMCQYSSDNGHATDWHLVHIGGYATRGVGAICVEAHAVVPEGRISPEDAGIWTDSQIAPLERIVKFSHAQGTKIGIQLAHAGRKASTYAPWVRPSVTQSHSTASIVAQKGEEKGWDVDGPSDIPFSDTYPIPRPLTKEGLKKSEDGFVKAIERCKRIGFDFIELHFAHGYLAHSFLSPLSNNRTDEFGGQLLENRIRWPLKIASLCREAWADKPLFVRISASDWAEELGPERSPDGKWQWWGIEQSKLFVNELKKINIDLVDVSSGGLYERQEIPYVPGYQVPFAAAIKEAIPDFPIGTVGLITSPTQAEGILQQGKADVVFLARELIRNPHWALQAALELGVAVKPANQYERGWTRLLAPKEEKPEKA